MAKYWSIPMRRVDRRMTTDTMVATKVNTKQKEAFSMIEDAVWSRRLSGVNSRREKRLARARLSTNLKQRGMMENNSDIFHLLLSVLNPLLLKKIMTRTVLRMVPDIKVMQMITSKTTRINKS